MLSWRITNIPRAPEMKGRKKKKGEREGRKEGKKHLKVSRESMALTVHGAVPEAKPGQMPSHQDRRGLKRLRERKAAVSCLGPLSNLIFRQKGRANYVLMDLLLSFFPNSQWLSLLFRQPANLRIALFTLPTQLSVEGSIF